MQKLYSYSKNKFVKFGFTLIELVLAMAITMLFLTVAFATFYLINTSHARVAVINDAKDFAVLNMQAIENLTADADAITLSNSSAIGASDNDKIAVYFVYNSTSKESTLYYQVAGELAQKAFKTYDQYTINEGAAKKWSVVDSTSDPIFSKTSTKGIVHVKIQIRDNSTGDIAYTLNKDLIFLNIDSASSILGASGNTIKFKNFSL